ncbi:senescence-associated carboxylesterase 101-like [Macadamia integrifolia]|uniref:senescence-associated carboxylesterase 101-like n=1 Tax=Macadamia integrifolia TaxID=60698 RepID=UPI001C4EC078|nr:senescence-associated carboxylesterase 101-like [Macadamia integrifolia]
MVEKVFSCGLELADVVLASMLPQSSLAAIQKLNDDRTKKSIRVSSLPLSLGYKAFSDDQNKSDIIAFGCEVEPVSSVDLSSNLEQLLPEFNFLQTKDNIFSINLEAVTLFRSLHLQDPDLFQGLRNPSRRLIVTGHSLGGWVASLFCLWLLEKIDKKNSNLPICITFGSPLLGDDGLRKAIRNQSGWYPRFLHVVSDRDIIPRTFLSSTTNNTYKPFGTFLMCSPSGSACFDDHDSILSLLDAIGSSQLPTNLMDYKNLLEHLTHQIIISKGASQLHELSGDSLRAGIILQLDAIGDNRMKEDNVEDPLITAMERRERMSYHKHKDRISKSEKKLNDSKMDMANLEWYKKICSSKVPIGYYDCYKRKQFPRDIDVVLKKKRLTKYWEDVVDDAERKPPKQGFVPLPTRLLGGGTNYRRMAEPLDIADYYDQGKTNYRTQGRPRHYKLLQTWQEEEERLKAEEKRLKEEKERAEGKERAEEKEKNIRDKAATLTVDSCFWADVEEAMILIESIKNGEVVEESPMAQLKKFEDYVMGLINNLAVSPEIFLESSFMKWWKEYEKITEPTHGSSLADFMMSKRYLHYK